MITTNLQTNLITNKQPNKMKNLKELTEDQIFETKVLMDKMCQLVFRKSDFIPMTKELQSIVNFITEIEELYDDQQQELENQ